MNRFVPSSTYSPLSRRATVRIAAESEPEPASVSAYAASTSPDASRGSQAARCSSEPRSLSPSEPSSCTARIKPLVAQTFETSSIATSESSVPVPVPPTSSAKKRPKIPWSRKSSTTSHGNSCDASISAARGAIRSRATVRTSSRSSRCSSLRTSQGTRRSVSAPNPAVAAPQAPPSGIRAAESAPADYALRASSGEHLGGHELAHLNDLVRRHVGPPRRLHDRVGRRCLVEAVGAQLVRGDEREEPADPLVRVDRVDRADVVGGQVELVGELALDDVERHRPMVLAPSVRDEAVAQGVRRRLGAVRAAGLAEDRADVVGGGVLADVENAADLAVRAAPRELHEDHDLARAQAVGQRRRRLDVGAELGGTAGEPGGASRSAH